MEFFTKSMKIVQESPTFKNLGDQLDTTLDTMNFPRGALLPFDKFLEMCRLEKTAPETDGTLRLSFAMDVDSPSHLEHRAKPRLEKYQTVPTGTRLENIVSSIGDSLYDYNLSDVIRSHVQSQFPDKYQVNEELFAKGIYHVKKSFTPVCTGTCSLRFDWVGPVDHPLIVQYASSNPSTSTPKTAEQVALETFFKFIGGILNSQPTDALNFK
jgi:hypothetical protein